MFWIYLFAGWEANYYIQKMVIECFQRLLDIFFLEEKLMIIHCFMRIFGHSSEENSLCYINFLLQRLQCPITAKKLWTIPWLELCSYINLPLNLHHSLEWTYDICALFLWHCGFLRNPKIKVDILHVSNYRGTCDENLIFHQNWTFHNCILSWHKCFIFSCFFFPTSISALSPA